MGRKKGFRKKQDLMKRIGKKRVEELCKLAFNTHNEDKILANRYIKHAREIAMSTKTFIPKKYKKNICHGCKQLILDTDTVRIRINHRKHYGTFISKTCLSCGHITRYIVKGSALREKYSVETIKNTEGK